MLKIKKIKNDAKEFSVMSFTLTREIGNASDPMRHCGTHNNKYWLIAFDFDELPAQKALKKNQTLKVVEQFDLLNGVKLVNVYTEGLSLKVCSA